MSTQEKLKKIPILNWLILILEKIKIPGLVGMTLYDLLEMYITGIIKGALTARAGSIAFSFFIALFPFALFVLTLIPYIPIDGFQEDLVDFIFHFLPSQTVTKDVMLVVDDIAKNKYGGLLSFGFILSIFLMTNGVNAILSGFEYTYHHIETRTIIRQYFVSMLISFGLAVLLVITVTVVIILGLLLNYLNEKGIVNDASLWLSGAQMIVIFIMLVVSISVLYYFGTKEGRTITFFSPGTVFTTILILLNFWVFKIYVEKFAQYNQLYGSIGTVLVIMLFIWLNSIILLLGFELNTSLIKLRSKKNAN